MELGRVFVHLALGAVDDQLEGATPERQCHVSVVPPFRHRQPHCLPLVLVAHGDGAEGAGPTVGRDGLRPGVDFDREGLCLGLGVASFFACRT